ncbi:MAG: butyrate kinase [Clostridia bacterium]|nr:butyrate kinase [Clostridia bacterium]
MNKKKYVILAVNPGSTSTKLAVYDDETERFRENIVHDQDALLAAEDTQSRMDMRIKAVRGALAAQGFDMASVSGVVGRGGLIPGLGMGGYYVNDVMRDVILSGKLISHASNLGALMARALADPIGVPSVIYDAVSADSLPEIARITGIPEIRRESFCHVLNSRAMARQYARSKGMRYEDMSLIVAHLGGGISVSAHKNGEIIDVITDDGGPFSPERAGSLPILYIIDMCFSGRYTREQVIRKQRGNGGLKALLGTSDCREIESRIKSGDERAATCYRAQAYQIAKGIGNLAPALNCKMDAIILTGGVAYSEMLTDMICEYVSALAPIVIMPGENEMRSLALGMLRILRGEEACAQYGGAERMSR